MPEGDTLFAAQFRLDPLLTGEVVREFWARKIRGYVPRAGQTVVAVRAVGKHLLIDFDRNLTLQTHLGMTGSWRTADDAGLARARRSPKLRVVIRVDAGAALCFAAPTISTYVRSSGDTPVAHLGPNLTEATLDFEEVLARLTTFHDDRSLLVDVLLDQRVTAGVGNVFKSEILHHRRLPPYACLGSLSVDERRELFAVAHHMMRANIAHPLSRRSTTTDGKLFVYGRLRLPCRRCDSPVRMVRNGTQHRSTYWCPTCQPPIT